LSCCRCIFKNHETSIQLFCHWEWLCFHCPACWSIKWTFLRCYLIHECSNSNVAM
jgi:hypothetical protein